MDPEPPYLWLVAGLSFAIIANVLMLTFWVDWYAASGNIVAILVCSFSLWLVVRRWRQYSR